jgi:carbonic anhydrase/acetyltransferase-like protein (isoleucine patch superfamily)
MPIYALGDVEPTIAESAYVHPDAVVIGDVVIDEDATIWPGAVLRGDYGAIRVGARTSIQDGTVLHTTSQWPTVIGADCVVGHNAYLEGCTVEDHCLIASGSLVLNQVFVGTGSVVAAGAVVAERTTVEAGTIVAGVPAKPRGSAEAFLGRIDGGVNVYVKNGARYKAELRRLD